MEIQEILDQNFRGNIYILQKTRFYMNGNGDLQIYQMKFPIQ